MTDWQRIVRNHHAMVFRIGYRLLGQTADAEDLAQDVFLEAYQISWRGTVSNWPGLLTRLVTLRGLDRLRRSPRMKALPANPVGRQPGPHEESVARELGDRLRSALGQLTSQQAAVFALAYGEQLTRDEIAATLETTADAVSTALFKARQRLAEILVPQAVENRT